MKITTTIKKVAFGLTAAMLTLPVYANDKLVWGGGDPESSAYSGTYVPHGIKMMDEVKLKGYKWAGISEGTKYNVEMVNTHLTHLAYVQDDISEAMNGQPMPNGDGTYSFTKLFKNLGWECFYMISHDSDYDYLGDIVGNAWDLTMFTGGKKSGSFGSLEVLQGVYPEMDFVDLIHVNDNLEILRNVKSTPGSAGFIAMRPDPSNDVFKEMTKMVKDGMSLIPVIDLDIDELYEYHNLKIANGGLWGDPIFHDTACTTVSMITGDPGKLDGPDDKRAKRLNATIERLSNLSEEQMTPSVKSWRDTFDSMKSVSASKLSEIKENSAARIKAGLERRGG